MQKQYVNTVCKHSMQTQHVAQTSLFLIAVPHHHHHHNYYYYYYYCYYYYCALNAADTLWRKLLYAGFETCFGPCTQVLGPKYISNPVFACKPF